MTSLKEQLDAVLANAARPHGERRDARILEIDGRHGWYYADGSPVPGLCPDGGFPTWLNAMSAAPRVASVAIKGNKLYGVALYL